jgi:hypothetical protein
MKMSATQTVAAYRQASLSKRVAAAPELLAAVHQPLDGLIASDKFCWTRYGRLRLAWWRRPLRLRSDRLV